jgi:hypothetical protein
MGQLPPDDMSGTELALALAHPKPVSEPFDFPRPLPSGKRVKVRVQLLSDREHSNARMEAEKKVKLRYGIRTEDLNSYITREVCGDASAREIIALAVVYEDPIAEGSPRYPKVFRDAEHAADALSSDELAALFAAYQLHQYRVGPLAREIGDESNVEKWIRRLEEAGDELPFYSLPLPQLDMLMSSTLDAMSGLFQKLASQWESLPDTLKSYLETSYSDTFSSGGRLVDGQGRARSESLPEPIGVTFREDMTLEDAAEIARQMKNAP